MSAKPKSHADQFERNRRKLVELCAAIKRASPPGAETAPEPKAPLTEKKARILLIDDSKFARGVVRGFLESHGHYVEEAADGNQGLERYSLNPHDLVITDIVMEEMGGLQVLNNLLALDPKARVIIASSNLQQLTRKEALERGSVALINKPINGEKLNQIVAALMAEELE